MSEDVLNFSAIAFELGVPAALLAAASLNQTIRPKVASVLGAISPYLFAYVATTVQWLLSDRSPESSFGFHAMWIMSFVPYVFGLIVGCVLAFWPKPDALIGRFLVSLAASVGLGGLVLLAEGAA